MIGIVIVSHEKISKELVERNKKHLRMMVAKDYWTDEDMTAVDAAIGD